MILYHNTISQIKKMIREGYVDDGCGGGTRHAVTELIQEVVDSQGDISYKGAIPEVLATAGFKVKVMVRDGESRVDGIAKLGAGVLGLAWDPAKDRIIMSL